MLAHRAQDPRLPDPRRRGAADLVADRLRRRRAADPLVRAAADRRGDQGLPARRRHRLSSARSSPTSIWNGASRRCSGTWPSPMPVDADDGSARAALGEGLRLLPRADRDRAADARHDLLQPRRAHPRGGGRPARAGGGAPPRERARAAGTPSASRDPGWWRARKTRMELGPSGYAFVVDGGRRRSSAVQRTVERISPTKASGPASSAAFSAPSAAIWSIASTRRASSLSPRSSTRRCTSSRSCTAPISPASSTPCCDAAGFVFVMALLLTLLAGLSCSRIASPARSRS